MLALVGGWRCRCRCLGQFHCGYCQDAQLGLSAALQAALHG